MNQSDPSQSEKIWTIKDVLDPSAKYLKSKSQSLSPRLDAELLLADTMNCKRIDLYVHYERPLLESQRALMRERLGRRTKGEPVAYILGFKEFFGEQYAVDSSVLIPRPDSEQLILSALDLLAETGGSDGTDRRVLDIGAGSGCLGITIALQAPKVAIEAWDVDRSAVDMARANALSLGVDDRFNPLLRDATIEASYPNEPRTFDLVISNPPYISQPEMAELSPNVADYEPHLALFGGQDGLDFYRALGEYVGRVSDNLIVEIGSTQASQVTDIFRNNGWSRVEVVKDLANLDRVVVARRDLS